NALRFKEGTLYPALHALEREGMIAGSWNREAGGRERKVYQITPAGLAALERRSRTWSEFSSAITRVIGGSPYEGAAGAPAPGRSLPAWAGVLAAFAGLALLEPLSLILSAWLPSGNHNLFMVGETFGVVVENHALLWDFVLRNALLTGLLGFGVGLVTPRRVN